MTDKHFQFMTSEELLNHWQGHRRLTRKVIETFPEKELFEFRTGSMRPYADMIRELTGLAGQGIHGIASGNWSANPELNIYDSASEISKADTKKKLLELWDRVTEEINAIWPEIPEGRFRETDKAWGMYEGQVWLHLTYLIDNENHHRGQGYTYLRSLGIEPPFFWERE